MKPYPINTKNRQIQIKSNMKPYPTNTNQITIETLNQLNTLRYGERERVVTCDRRGATKNWDPNTHQRSHPK